MHNDPLQKPQPLINNWLKLFMVAMILANLGGNMYGPLLPIYLKGSLGASISQIGLFFMLLQIFSLVLQILGGWISDSLGRLRSVAIASVAGVFSYIALILAPSWQWMLLGEGLNAVTRSLVAPSYAAFIAEQTVEQNRSRVFAITEMLFTVVTIFGPPLGGWMVEHWNFRIMLVCAGIFYTLAAVLRIAMARAAARGHESRPQSLSLESFRSNLSAIGLLILGGGLVFWILVSDSIRDIAYTLSSNLMPIYLDEIGGLSVQQIGWLQSVFGVCVFLVNFPAGWLADHKGERVAIVLGFLVQFLALVVFLMVRTFLGYAVAWGLLGVGVALMSPAYQSFASKVIPQHLRGIAFGLLQSSVGILAVPAPKIGTELWERFGPATPFRITAGLLLVTILPVWKKFRLPAAQPEPAEPLPAQSPESAEEQQPAF